MERPITIAGISGSLRKASFNTATLHLMAAMAPAGMTLDVVTLDGVEPFDTDVEAKGWPTHVAALREQIGAADAVIFATPEYNYSIPGVLKNAIDWLSRPERKSPLFGKPAGIIGASTSRVGTARAQAHLRQILFYNAMPLLPSAEVLIAQAAGRFDDQGRLTDDATRQHLADFWTKYAAWVRRQLE